MNKKLIVILLAVVMIFTACGKTEPGKVDPSLNVTDTPDAGQVVEIPLTDEDKKRITETAENINDAYLCYCVFMGGHVETGAQPLGEKDNPYPQANYYPLADKYATMDSIKEYFLQYYSNRFFEKYVLGELESDDNAPPYLLNIDGRLYCNLNYGVGDTPVPETDTIKITSYTGYTAKFEIYRHHPLDESVRKILTAELVKENGKWVYNRTLWW